MVPDASPLSYLICIKVRVELTCVGLILNYAVTFLVSITFVLQELATYLVKTVKNDIAFQYFNHDNDV